MRRCGRDARTTAAICAPRQEDGGEVLPATINGRVSANYDGRKDVLSDLATDHHVTRREAAEALKARNIPAQGKQR